VGLFTLSLLSANAPRVNANVPVKVGRATSAVGSSRLSRTDKLLERLFSLHLTMIQSFFAGGRGLVHTTSQSATGPGVNASDPVQRKLAAARQQLDGATYHIQGSGDRSKLAAWEHMLEVREKAAAENELVRVCSDVSLSLRTFLFLLNQGLKV
jgi:hypothetical protein